MAETEGQRDYKLISRTVKRRDLLKAGAATAVIPAVIGPATGAHARASKANVAGERELAAGPFSVGYWSGDPDTTPMSAKAISAGDKQFARYGAKIEMLGMCPLDDDESVAHLQSLALDISLQPVAYRAWRFENTTVRNVSSPNTFSVPVDDKKGLTFTVTAASKGLSGVPKAGGFRLSLGKESSLAKLQAGYYVVAIGQRGRGLRVNWANYELRGDNSGQSIALYRNDKLATDFPYVLFSAAVDVPTPDDYI